jgi:hypothetical protein
MKSVPRGVGVEFADVVLLKDRPQAAQAPARNVSKETLTVKDPLQRAQRL